MYFKVENLYKQLGKYENSEDMLPSIAFLYISKLRQILSLETQQCHTSNCIQWGFCSFLIFKGLPVRAAGSSEAHQLFSLWSLTLRLFLWQRIIQNIWEQAGEIALRSATEQEPTVQCLEKTLRLGKRSSRGFLCRSAKCMRGKVAQQWWDAAGATGGKATSSFSIITWNRQRDSWLPEQGAKDSSTRGL